MHRIFQKTTRQSGFTLLEIMVVVVILGALAMLALPTYNRLQRKTVNTTFYNDFKTVSGAINLYAMEKGEWPPDGAGALPPEILEYLPPPIGDNKPTPIGGRWVWVDSGVSQTLQVLNHTTNTAQLEAIDSLLDNGDLSSGNMVTVGQSLVYTLEP